MIAAMPINSNLGSYRRGARLVLRINIWSGFTATTTTLYCIQYIAENCRNVTFPVFVFISATLSPEETTRRYVWVPMLSGSQQTLPCKSPASSTTHWPSKIYLGGLVKRAC